MLRRAYLLTAGLGISAAAALFLMLSKTPAQPAKVEVAVKAE